MQNFFVYFVSVCPTVCLFHSFFCISVSIFPYFQYEQFVWVQNILFRSEIDWLMNFLRQVPSPVVFSHNDINCGNILVCCCCLLIHPYLALPLYYLPLPFSLSLSLSLYIYIYIIYVIVYLSIHQSHSTPISLSIYIFIYNLPVLSRNDINFNWLLLLHPCRWTWGTEVYW